MADWECVRGTSYIYPSTPLAPVDAAAFEAAGFEIGAPRQLQLRRDWKDSSSLRAASSLTQLADFATK